MNKNYFIQRKKYINSYCDIFPWWSSSDYKLAAKLFIEAWIVYGDFYRRQRWIQNKLNKVNKYKLEIVFQNTPYGQMVNEMEKKI